MQMPGRVANAKDYRYGFNGQEKDDEIAGSGNSYTAEHWQYDPRLGRRWNIDPIIKPWESHYATFSNNPVYFVDPNGLDSKDPKESKTKDGEGTVYSDNDNKRSNGNTSQTFNNECQCYINDGLLKDQETSAGTPQNKINGNPDPSKLSKEYTKAI